MSEAFVWFHNGSEDPASSANFYHKLLGWKTADGPGGMTMLLARDAATPFAGVAAQQGKVGGWVPYAQVDDVDAAARKAVKLGAVVLQDRTRGPAGDFTVVRDPGGAIIALWQKA